MKVAFVTNFIPPYRRSFYEKLCRSGAGFEWLLIRGTTGEEGRLATNEGIDVPQREVVNAEYKVGPFTLRWQRGALKAVRDWRPQVIVLLGISGTLSNWALLLWAWWHRVPVLMWTCGWEPHALESVAFRFKKRIASVYFRAATRLLVYSTKGQRYVETLGVPHGRISVCYNGIEIDHLLGREAESFAAAAKLREREIGPNSLVVLFVGAMLAQKRLDLLIEAFAVIRRERPQAQLWLVGDGPEREAMEHLVAGDGVPGVRFFGRIVDGVDAYFSAADVVVLPGIGGLALNEAMFWGRPCVVGVADGTEDDLVIDGVTGCRFADGDRASLTLAISRCLDLTADERKRWGEAGRQLIVKRSNVSHMVETFLIALSELRDRAQF
jgi:glycosyltransferase involved in cell wall biosynthesis